MKNLKAVLVAIGVALAGLAAVFVAGSKSGARKVKANLAAKSKKREQNLKQTEARLDSGDYEIKYRDSEGQNE